MTDKEDYFVVEALEDVRDGKMTVEEATEFLLNEMGRGGRILVVDEHLDGLDDALAKYNFTVTMVRKGTKDEDILPTLDNRVFITKDYERFEKDMNEYNFGLIAVKGKYGDYQQLSKRIKIVMMGAGFRKNLRQVVPV